VLKSPVILESTVLAKTRIFTIEELRVQFPNKKIQPFETIKPNNFGAVMIIPILDADTFFIIREYAAGSNHYFLGFPKGAINKGENLLETANRELMEEIGYGAKKLTHLRQMSLSPAYFNATMQLVLAEDLYPKKLMGDEPEPIVVIPWKFSEIDALLQHPEFHESRSIAALLLLEKMQSRRIK